MTYGNYPNHCEIKRILIIKLRHLGDVLLSTPTFSCLKKALPNAFIDVLINKEAAPILINNPHINNLIIFDRNIKSKRFYSKMLYEFNFYKMIRKKKYDLVINLTDGDRARLVSKISKAKTTVGMQSDNQKLNKNYSHIIKKCHLERHVVEKDLDSIRRIGIFPEYVDRNLEFFYSPPLEGGKIKNLVERLGSDFILIHPTCRWRFKCWSEKNLRALIERLQFMDQKIVITSGPSKNEIEMINRILKGLNRTNIFDISGKTSIDEIAYLIHNCKALICVDSFVFHIANCFKKDVVALFGPTSDITWGPWKNPNAKVVSLNLSCRPCFLDGCGGSKVSDCLYRITVEQVLKALNDFIPLNVM
jgi:lipopolysaccharide heptosyltransferase III